MAILSQRRALTCLLALLSSPLAAQVVATFEDEPISCALLRAAAASEGGTDPRDVVDALSMLTALAAETVGAVTPRLVEEKLLSRWARARIEEEVSVSDEEILVYFEGHREEFSRPAKISTRMILRSLDGMAKEGARQEAFAELDELRRRILEDELDFGDAAREFSDGENASQGGAVAASPRGTLLEEYEQLAWAMEEGEISPPTLLPGGAYLVLLERRFASREADFETSAESARNRLHRQLVTERTAVVLGEMKPRYPLHIDRAAALTDPPDEIAVRLGNWSGTLADLGFQPRATRGRRLDEAVDAFLLARWMEARLSPDRQGELELERLRHLAEVTSERLLDASVPSAPPATERDLYDRGRRRLSSPERRTLAVLWVRGDRGQRKALATAHRVRTEWESPLESPAPEATLEVWGPVTVGELQADTSPRLGRALFGLAEGEISEPVPFDRYEGVRPVPDGYLVARTLSIEPSVMPSFEEALPRIRRFAAGTALATHRASLHQELMEGRSPSINEPALATCLKDW